MEKNLLQGLTDYANEGWVPFHMPGHKRAPLGGGLPWQLDITEIAGFDDLKDPRGLLLDLTRQAAAHWGADEAWIGVNGSTGAILSGLRAMTKRGDTVLVARNCHMSVFHAIELRELRPVILEPEWLPNWGIYGRVAQETLDQALAAHPEAALCVITSPTYEGFLSELACPIPLYVDAAHGAHLPLPNSDLVNISTHKTLPALTQTALLHVRSSRVDIERLERQLRVFQTSSPSYVLMASIERCVALLEEQREELFEQWRQRLDAFYDHARQWQSLRLLRPDDRSKLVVHCGMDPTSKLHKHRIEPEYIQNGRALFLTSPCDTDEMMAALAAALDALDVDCGNM